MNHWLPIIFLQFISLASATALCAEHDRTCVDVYQAPAVRANFVDELALISALEKNNPPSTEIFQKYGSVLKQLPWARQHTIDLLRIGFKEQIFCNPWPLSIKEIAQKLSRGDFTNALVRELEQANTTPYVMLPGDLMTHMHSAPNVLLSQVRRIKSPFPDEVSIRDPQMQDFTSNFFYYLHPADHKLYIKPNPRKGNVANILKWGVMELHRNGDKLGNRTEWNLFNGDGGPPLSPGRNLVQFSVGSEIVAALDNVGQFYLFKPTEHKTPTQWTTKIGCPIPDKLFLPRDHERWSFSCSVKIKPKERRTIEFMHPDDIVHYYEDSDNKKIDFGFTATVFVLSADGRRIGYWDTGLASHFGRAFTTPHRGNFVADNLSAAGSTIMVIGRNSEGAYEIYTRMFDYEINGACPGEQHTYLKTSAPTPNRVLELLEAQRRLPLPGWQKMADIELVQGDSLSDRISIELTGQGNAARMLKVTGTKNSIDGYYYKMITDNAWQFQPAHEKNNGPSRTPLHEPLQVQKRNDMDYVGRIKASLTTHEQMAHGIKLISLKQFHYFLGADEPATIEITTTNQKTVTLWLHTNDAYSIASQKRGREDLIGNKDGEPKMLVGTLIIPPEYLDANDQDLVDVVAMFKPFHLKMNAFNVLANDEAVVLKSVERFIDLDKNFATITLPPLTMRFTRNAGPGYYEQLIAKPHYWVTPSDSTKEIKTVIKHNQALLALLNRDKKELAAEARKNAVVLGGTNWMFQIWKRFHFVDMGVVHSLRKFLHHENLHSLMPRERTNDAIEHAEATVNHRIETFSSMLEE